MYPPNGVLISPSEKVLTDTVPHGRLFARWNALSISWVNTLACNPYFELLATFKALKVASNSKYGLHASVFTQDIDRAFHLAKSLPCGTVSVNTFSEGDIKTPFGGYKQSGSLSRDQGTEALNSFLQTKTIWISHQ